ncbi:MAG: DUF2914 domain-containing protein [Natronospirillum sp.]
MKRIFALLACSLFPAGLAMASNHEAELDAATAPGEVARAIFTAEIEDREPAFELRGIPEGMDEVYLFTDLRDFQGQTVTHRWSYAGNIESEVSFDVGGPRWRTWSLKSIPSNQRGEWSVDIVDGEGYIVNTYTISAR